jgi:hypothetical protein
MSSALAGVILQETNPNFGNPIVKSSNVFAQLNFASQNLKFCMFLAKVVLDPCIWSDASLPEPFPPFSISSPVIVELFRGKN